MIEESKKIKDFSPVETNFRNGNQNFDEPDKESESESDASQDELDLEEQCNIELNIQYLFNTNKYKKEVKQIK